MAAGAGPGNARRHDLFPGDAPPFMQREAGRVMTGQSDLWALAPALVLLATVVAAGVAHVRPLWPFARARQGVVPALVVGAVAFFLSLGAVGDKLAAPPPQTEAEAAQDAWTSVRDAVARRAMGPQSRSADMRDTAVFRHVRVYRHDAPLPDPSTPSRTLGMTAACGEVAVIRGMGEVRDGDFRPFISAGDYTTIQGDMRREPPPWSWCAGRVVLAAPDGERVRGRR